MFVLALLMLIGGLAAMVQGIPFVRLEVGWTMVIAGTVGASAGAVLLGITAVVARLGRIERALAGRGADHPVPARPIPEHPIPERAAPVPAFTAPAASETGAAPIRALRGEPALPPVLPPIPFPAVTPPAPEPRPAEPTGHDGGAALAAGAGLAVGLAASELRLTRAEDTDPPAEPPEPTHGAMTPRELAHPELAPHDLAHREPYPPVEEPRFEMGASHDEPASPPPHVLQAAEPPPPPPPPADPAPPPPPAEEEFLPDEPPGKTVIGTYDSGGNTYTMYADGTIDAETPAGRFHFASIEELKAFRSAGGEGAARSA
ncbi:hypothetical protein FF100_18515 [Methylobacterium terricola]|uniref:Uncharacterized protein n=1 Tax=Methylobacterium terricola TaxID=2583531 RepID=A0A5C4LH80_9HYPH|nr:hypothetical protein FF100_18515 [Methylobacterium terricola]